MLNGSKVYGYVSGRWDSAIAYITPEGERGVWVIFMEEGEPSTYDVVEGSEEAEELFEYMSDDEPPFYGDAKDFNSLWSWAGGRDE